MHSRRMARHRDSGFTLVELLVTISIIGVLAGIAAFGVSGIRSRSVLQACITDVKTAQLAADSYRTKFGAYPANEPALLTGGVVTRLTDAKDYTITYSSSPGPYTLTVTRSGSPRSVTAASTKAQLENACKA